MTDLRKDLLDIEAWLNTRFVHREEVVEALIYAALTRSNVLQLGPPGTAKSLVSRAFAACMGGRLFVEQLHQFTGQEDLTGPIDMARFNDSNVWERKWEGYMPTADFVHLDEIDKAGPAVFGLLLTMLNERTAKHGSVEHALPYLFAVGTMNADLDDPTGAMFDRWLLRTVVDYVADGSDFQALLSMGDVDWSSPPVTDLAAVRAAHREVGAVKLTTEAREGMAALRGSLASEGIRPSDRRWVQSVALVQAAAWLAGRTEAGLPDLAPLRLSLWVDRNQADTVTGHVLTLASPHAKEIRELAVAVDTVQAKLAEMKGRGAESESRAELTSFSVSARAELNRAYRRLVEISAESGLKEKAEARRLALRLPDIAADLMIATGLMRSREAAMTDIAVSMPPLED